MLCFLVTSVLRFAFLPYYRRCVEAYSEFSQTSKMEFFTKIVTYFQPLHIFAKRYIIDVWLCLEYLWCRFVGIYRTIFNVFQSFGLQPVLSQCSHLCQCFPILYQNCERALERIQIKEKSLEKNLWTFGKNIILWPVLMKL